MFIGRGMGLQIPIGGLQVSIGDDGETHMTVDPMVRLDLWTVWLEVGCVHASDAAEVAAMLATAVDDEDRSTLLRQELQQAMVAVTAFAFALDGFYDVTRQELGDHPHAEMWRRRREESRPPPRHAQVAETLRFHLKLGPNFTAQLKTFLRELFEFRGRAVHPSSRFLKPNYRPEIDSGVHPHFVTFSGPHAVHCRALALSVLNALVRRAREVAPSDSDTGWLDWGSAELERLLAAHPVSADHGLAFEEHLASPPPPNPAPLAPAS